MRTTKAWNQKLWSTYMDMNVMAGIGIHTGAWVRIISSVSAIKLFLVAIVVGSSPVVLLAQTPRPGEPKPAGDSDKSDKKEGVDSAKKATNADTAAKPAKPKRKSWQFPAVIL